MFENGSFGYFGTTSTDTEEEQSVDTASQQQASFGVNTDDSNYDDYSVTPNYSEQQSYDTTTAADDFQGVQEEVKTDIRSINLPNIDRQEQEVVSLTKTKQKIVLSPRMKTLIATFSIIMAALLFLISWNFASIGGIQQTVASQEVTISQLRNSISRLSEEYNEVGSEEELRERAENAGYVDSTSENTFNAKLGEFYTEESTQQLPSNWFNDFCDFLSRLFS